MIWADYDFYRSSYGGDTVPREAFAQTAARANAFLESLLQLPAGQSLPQDKARLALCELCDRLYQEKKRGGLLQESADGYAVRYDRAALCREALDIARRYLGGDGVLYRGRRP